jgi:hypothetical protein
MAEVADVEYRQSIFIKWKNLSLQTTGNRNYDYFKYNRRDNLPNSELVTMKLINTMSAITWIYQPMRYI